MTGTDESSTSAALAYHTEMRRLCEGGAWRMSIPANPQRDSDFIISTYVEELEAVRHAAEPEVRQEEPATETLDVARLGHRFDEDPS